MEHTKAGLYLTILTLAGMLYGAFPFRIGVVVGESMSPSLENGAVYLMDRRTQPLRRGDVAVFDHRGATYVKRVLAIPGDSFYVVTHPGSRGDVLVMDYQVELLRGALDPRTSRTPLRLVRRTVPRGTFYVVGDNLQGSKDSREFGPVRFEQLRGKMLFAPPMRPTLKRVVAGGQAGS